MTHCNAEMFSLNFIAQNKNKNENKNTNNGKFNELSFLTPHHGEKQFWKKFHPDLTSKTKHYVIFIVFDAFSSLLFVAPITRKKFFCSGKIVREFKMKHGVALFCRSCVSDRRIEFISPRGFFDLWCPDDSRAIASRLSCFINCWCFFHREQWKSDPWWMERREDETWGGESAASYHARAHYSSLPDRDSTGTR